MTAVVMVLCLLMAGFEVATLAPLPLSFSSMVRQAALSWTPWFVGAPLIAWIGVRFRPRSQSWRWVLGAHLLGCVIMLAASLAMGAWLTPILNDKHSPAGHMLLPPAGSWDNAPPDSQHILSPDAGLTEWRAEPHANVDGMPVFATTVGLPFDVLLMLPTYLFLTLVVQALLAFGEIKDRKVAEAHLRTELARSQLAALRMQVNPHFLFNTLNSVNALMATDVAKARGMLSDLSDLLRSAFRDTEKHEVSLSEELNLVKRYVAIQKVRFGGRLSLLVDAPQEVQAACVPALCLQPLIENSVVHAVEKCARPCKIKVTVRRRGERLNIEVRDNGPGAAAESTSGIGLANTKARLAKMYGGLATLEVETSPDRGFCVNLTLPFRDNSEEVELRE
jgi:hypothetical protein